MQTIPTPRRLPFIGNVLDINPDSLNASLSYLAQTYGK
jgi:hypothetical protein